MVRTWKLHERLGRGGFGDVFRARLADGQMVAIKQITKDQSISRPLASFHKEAAIASKLDHPNIVKIFGVETEDTERVCLVMELVDGIDLARLLGLCHVPMNAALYIVRALLSALVHVHGAAGVVHRDVAPHNVLLSWEGEVKLSDFGIAKPIGQEPTRGGPPVGRMRYISPEQFRNQPTDARSDLFVVGVVLYQLLTGQTPDGATDDSLHALLTGAATPAPLTERSPGLCPALCAVVMRLMAYEPHDRYQSAGEALEALPAPVGGQGELKALMHHVRELGLIGHRGRRARTMARRRWRVMQAALVLLGIGVGAGATIWRLGDAPASSVPVTPEPASLPPAPPPGPQPADEPDTTPANEPPAPDSHHRRTAPRAWENYSPRQVATPSAAGLRPGLESADF